MEIAELDVVTISQNERYVPTRGWSSRNLFANDPRHYSQGAAGGDQPDDAAPLLSGESWVDASWRACIDASTDANGWRYGRSFGAGAASPVLAVICKRSCAWSPPSRTWPWTTRRPRR